MNTIIIYNLWYFHKVATVSILMILIAVNISYINYIQLSSEYNFQNFKLEEKVPYFSQHAQSEIPIWYKALDSFQDRK